MPGGESVLALVGTAAALYAVQVIVGALQITTKLAAWAVALHLALGALIWALVVGAAFVGYFAARTASVDRATPSRSRAGCRARRAGSPIASQRCASASAPTSR